jgi:hypothetical protein
VISFVRDFADLHGGHLFVFLARLMQRHPWRVWSISPAVDRTVAALRELAGSATGGTRPAVGSVRESRSKPSRITVEFMRFGARESQVSIEHRLRFAASARRLAVVEKVLRDARVPLTAQQIVTRARGRLPSAAKRLDVVVARDLSGVPGATVREFTVGGPTFAEPRERRG